MGQGWFHAMSPEELDQLAYVRNEEEVLGLPADREMVMACHITDAMACALGRLGSLRILLTDGNNLDLTDRGLQCIGNLTRLEQLDLEWATFSDAGLQHLCHLKRLRWLDLSHCQGFSEAAHQALRLALPTCEFE